MNYSKASKMEDNRASDWNQQHTPPKVGVIGQTIQLVGNRTNFHTI